MFHAERKIKKVNFTAFIILDVVYRSNKRYYYIVTSLKRLSLFFSHQGIMEPAEPVHIGESQGFMAEGKPVEPIKVSWNPRNQSKIKVLWRGNP